MPLTDFSTEEQEVIKELEKRTMDCVTPKMLEDNLLFYRFAKARDFNTAEAEIMLRKHVSWRKDFGIDTILTDYKPPEVLVKYIPSNLMCFDKEGCAVRYVDCGRADSKGLLNSSNKLEMLKYFAYRIEQDKEELVKRNKKLGKQLYFAIFDLENMPHSLVTNMQVVSHLLYFLKAYIDNFPEILKYAIIINAPFYFVWSFPIFKQIIPAAVLKKVEIYGRDGWRKKLLELIDADVLPVFLGGNKTDPDGNPNCKTFMKRGEPIPKSYYKRNEKKKMGGSYEKLTILPFCKEEISFDVEEENSNLEWEFEIKSGDIDFSLHFKGETLDNVELIPKQRADTCYETEKGFFKCEKVGTYTMVLDNSYSWIYPKEVYCKATIRPPNYERSEELL